MSLEENPELSKLREQAQAFVQSKYNKPVLVTTAVLCYEVIDPEGTSVKRTVDYATLAEHPSFSSDYGVVAIIQAQLIAVGVEMGEADEEDEEA